MNGNSGIKIVQWITERFSNTVRIMLTEHADIAVMKQAINKGQVFRFLTKPYRDVDSAAAIRNGLETQPAQ